MATAKEIMDKKVITVNESDSLQDASKVLVKKRLSGIPVVNKKGSLIGFISERDIIAAVSSNNFQKMKVSDAMVCKVTSVEENTPLEHISHLFTNKPVRRIPVTRKGRLIGIVSREDIINRLLGHYY